MKSGNPSPGIIGQGSQLEETLSRVGESLDATLDLEGKVGAVRETMSNLGVAGTIKDVTDTLDQVAALDKSSFAMGMARLAKIGKKLADSRSDSKFIAEVKKAAREDKDGGVRGLDALIAKARLEGELATSMINALTPYYEKFKEDLLKEQNTLAKIHSAAKTVGAAFVNFGKSLVAIAGLYVSGAIFEVGYVAGQVFNLNKSESNGKSVNNIQKYAQGLFDKSMKLLKPMNDMLDKLIAGVRDSSKRRKDFSAAISSNEKLREAVNKVAGRGR